MGEFAAGASCADAEPTCSASVGGHPPEPTRTPHPCGRAGINRSARIVSRGVGPRLAGGRTPSAAGHFETRETSKQAKHQILSSRTAMEFMAAGALVQPDFPRPRPRPRPPPPARGPPFRRCHMLIHRIRFPSPEIRSSLQVIPLCELPVAGLKVFHPESTQRAGLHGTLELSRKRPKLSRGVSPSPPVLAVCCCRSTQWCCAF